MGREKPPCVSVVMAVYNGETYLCDTVSSILKQTFRDFEYIIVNDGSTDKTESILASLTDPRIIVICNEQNKGLPYSLNRGLAIAKGKYIARIDVGDRALPERLAKQVAFLKQYQEIGIVGSRCLVLDDTDNERGIFEVPLNDLDIRWTSLLNNPFIHPSVMIRRDVLCRHHLNYDEIFQASQDYELWTRLLEHTCGANLEDLLTRYRISDKSITVQSRSIQLKNHDFVAFRTIRQQLPDLAISQEQVSQLREAFAGGGVGSKHERKMQRVICAGLYLDLLTAFAKKHHDDPGIKALQRCASLNIVKKVLRLRFSSYWFPVLKRAIRLYPGIVFPLFRYLITKYALKKRQRFILK